MPFDAENKNDVIQLSKAVGYSRGCLKVFRENRLKLIREYVGKNYSDDGASDKVPINLLELAMNIYLQRLVAQNPAVSITTDYAKLKEICTRFELAGNHLIEEIKLGRTLELIVIGAMLSKGIIKIGLNRTTVEVGGILHDTGQPFAEAVSLDDWVEDMTVDSDENSQYEGNYYYPTIDEAEAMFPDWVGKLTPQSELAQTEDKAHKISEGETTQREEFRPTVKLLDLFLKKQGLVLQCLAKDDDNDPIQEVLKVIKWTGPENGPYRKLGFSKVENSTMPVAPAMHWIDMHELTNRLFRKLGRQADREKTVYGVRPGGEQDGNRTIDANDGEMIKMDDPRNVGEMHYGGASPTTLAFVLQVKDMFSYMAGNLDMLGGLGPQSDTLGQDQLLSVSASMRIQKMQKEVVEFTQDVLKDLMFYLWYDPSPEQTPVVKKVKGFESISVTVPFNPEDREGDYLQYNIKIEPFSMQHQSPESKMQGIRTLFSEIIIPSMPMIQSQGGSVDMQTMMGVISKLTNIPELKDIITFSNPVLQSEPIGESNQVAGKAPVTTRRYERVNRPGATNSGKSQILQQALLGSKPQASEIASLGRPTS
jgi:hypothetical protein